MAFLNQYRLYDELTCVVSDAYFNMIGMISFTFTFQTTFAYSTKIFKKIIRVKVKIDCTCISI